MYCKGDVVGLVTSVIEILAGNALTACLADAAARNALLGVQKS